MIEEEYYSICCQAPPLHDLCLDRKFEMQIGECMCCREYTSFEIKENENE